MKSLQIKLARMLFLGIVVDTIKMTLELDDCRLAELQKLLLE